MIPLIKNINKINRGKIMIIRCMTILEVYETPQSGFFFDYNNDET
jgi:hypothetical protein